MRTEFQKELSNQPGKSSLSSYQKFQTLSYDKTLEIFKKQQEMEQNAFKIIDRVKESEVKDEYLVQNAYIADYLLIQYGVTSDQYNKAIIDHDTLNSPEAQAIQANQANNHI